jgi:hypothetical protein
MGWDVILTDVEEAKWGHLFEACDDVQGKACAESELKTVAKFYASWA